ncbi:c-type cytochrome [Anianabacter salinae]|uniref:c-type cytochrome n=1 Tax=Anianabacter salinae TaxID=2851023 RepID=UPI00225E466F|nr:cytochrome C [Anianabacter salinae]MBV0914215.1 cytochrome C [Anianabacter salinae]
MLRTTAILAAMTLSAPAFAASHATGDAAAGEDVFRQCITCHVIQDDDGETIAGRGQPNRAAPNLYGVWGRQAGTIEEFNYSDSMVEAGEAGLMWNQEDFVAYVQDPTGFLREYLDDNRARGKMSFRVRSEDDAANVWAYLVQFGGGAPEGEMEEGEEAPASN